MKQPQRSDCGRMAAGPSTVSMSTSLPFPEPQADLDQNFSKVGTALTPAQRMARAHRKGLCSRCHIRTHKVSFRGRAPLTNDDVYNGHCIKCDPDMVPLKICVEWEERNPDKIALAKRTQLNIHRGTHRQTPGANAASNHGVNATASSHGGGEQDSLQSSTLRSSAASAPAFSLDRCATCGIQTHENKVIKSKRASLLGRKTKETRDKRCNSVHDL